MQHHVFNFPTPGERAYIKGGSGTGTVPNMKHHPLGASAGIVVLGRFMAERGSKQVRQERFGKTAFIICRCRTYRHGHVDACAIRINKRDAWSSVRTGPPYSNPNRSLSACSEGDIASASPVDSPELSDSSSSERDTASKSPSLISEPRESQSSLNLTVEVAGR